MKYMGAYYRTRTTRDLAVLRSQKYNRLRKIQQDYPSYWNMQERRKLQTQINWIEAELQCRKEQMALDLE